MSGFNESHEADLLGDFVDAILASTNEEDEMTWSVNNAFGKVACRKLGEALRTNALMDKTPSSLEKFADATQVLVRSQITNILYDYKTTVEIFSDMISRFLEERHHSLFSKESERTAQDASDVLRAITTLPTFRSVIKQCVDELELPSGRETLRGLLSGEADKRIDGFQRDLIAKFNCIVLGQQPVARHDQLRGLLLARLS